jgi:hypothetical protein
VTARLMAGATPTVPALECNRYALRLLETPAPAAALSDWSLPHAFRSRIPRPAASGLIVLFVLFVPPSAPHLEICKRTLLKNPVN